MKQLTLSWKTGEAGLADVPVPRPADHEVLVASECSIISAGTERMLVRFAQAGLVRKAAQQPERVRQTVRKIRTDGLRAAGSAVRARLETATGIGYCNAGVVVEVAGAAGDFRVGDRVVTNGPHAEFVCVPRTLTASIPDGVACEAAAFTPLAAIALQGIRLADPTLGETVVVFGLGMVGLLSVQLVRAAGCQVVGIDLDPARLELAESLGAVVIDARHADPIAKVQSITGGVGADAVLLTLDSSDSEPVRQAAGMSRKRGRLVLVGVTGLKLAREDFYEKELSFQVSSSYGPGRYDPQYEDRGRDYPLPYVRWTAKRNFEAVLRLMAEGTLDPAPLISHRFSFSEAPAAYEMVLAPEPSLGITLTYADTGVRARDRADDRSIQLRENGSRDAEFAVGVIGAGAFAVQTILPALAKTEARLVSIASRTGLSSTLAGEKLGFERATTDVSSILDDTAVDTVFILTRHDSHAELASLALAAGKHVFVEKPLALTEEELERVQRAAKESGRILTVGFNRRFAPLAVSARSIVADRTGPLALNINVNAGTLPVGHWAGDPEIGGGRIVGEACHFIDLARFMAGSPIADVAVTTARDREGSPVEDISLLSMTFEDGSVASVQYLANGSRAFPKERVECFADGNTVVIDNWRRLRTYGNRAPRPRLRRHGDKGHGAEMRALAAAVRTGGPAPIPLDELFETSRWTIRAAAMARR